NRQQSSRAGRMGDSGEGRCSFPRADGEAWVYTPRWYPSE
ncbi:hypothetical protein ACLBVR_29510, partial [Pseudomonas aeruginosa]